jgi:hypothetical protein
MNIHFAVASRRSIRLAGAFGLALLTGAMAACGSDSPVGPLGGSTGAKLSVINGAPGAVRVVVDGVTRIPSLSAASVSTALDVGIGSHAVELQAIASGTLSGVSSTSITANAGDTAFVTAHAGASGAVVAGVVSDSGSVPAPGMSKLRVINLAASAPALDVWRTQPDFATPIRMMFPFPYAAQSSFIQSTAGTWEVIVTNASTPTPGEPDPRTNALATLTLTINADVAQTVVILDKVGGGVTLSLLAGN